MSKTMGVSPITDTIFYGTVKDNKWVGKREDVTDMAIKAVFEWFMNKLRDAGEDDNTFEVRFPGCPYVLEMRKEEKGEDADNV